MRMMGRILFPPSLSCTHVRDIIYLSSVTRSYSYMVTQ